MSNSKKKNETEVENQLYRISQRLDHIEDEMQKKHGGDDNGSAKDDQIESCGLPVVPVRELEAGIDFGRESLIRSIEKKWVNGTDLKYYFLPQGIGVEVMISRMLLGKLLMYGKTWGLVLPLPKLIQLTKQIFALDSCKGMARGLMWDVIFGVVLLTKER